VKEYRVTTAGEQEFSVMAKDAASAKRQVCRWLGVSPTDQWVGMRGMMAKENKPERTQPVDCNTGEV
jgi:hypothetical protein